MNTNPKVSSTNTIGSQTDYTSWLYPIQQTVTIPFEHYHKMAAFYYRNAHRSSSFVTSNIDQNQNFKDMECSIDSLPVDKRNNNNNNNNNQDTTTNTSDKTKTILSSNATTTSTKNKIIRQPSKERSLDNVHSRQEPSQKIVQSSFSSVSSITFSNKSTHDRFQKSYRRPHTNDKQIPKNEKRIPITNVLTDKTTIRSTNIHDDHDNSSMTNQASHGSNKRRNVHESEPAKRKQSQPIETHEMFQVLAHEFAISANTCKPLEDTNSNKDNNLESQCLSKASHTMDNQKQASVHKHTKSQPTFQHLTIFTSMASSFPKATTTTTTDTQITTSDDNEIEKKLFNNKQLLIDNGLHIPDRYYVRMVQTGLIDELIKLVNNVNQTQKFSQLLELKHLADEELREQNEFIKKYCLNGNSTRSEPVFFDPEVDDEIRPDTTYFGKSFYGSD